MLDELQEWLDEIEHYLEGRMDVRDGSYGIPKPNREMTLLADLRVIRQTMPKEQTPFSRSRAALPANIRKTLEESNLPIEVATAIADLCEGKIARPEEGECEACAAWNLVCPKCGASKGGECGWPTNCPTGQNRSKPQTKEDQ